MTYRRDVVYSLNPVVNPFFQFADTKISQKSYIIQTLNVKIMLKF